MGTVIAHLDIEQTSAEYTLFALFTLYFRRIFFNQSFFSRPKLDAIQPRGILTAEKLDTKEILFTVDKLIPEISQS